MSREGRVEAIFLTGDAAAPLEPVEEVNAVAGVGLEGDRYFHKRGTFSHRPMPGREVTLIEAESIEAARRDYDLDVTFGDARRNVVTRGVALNHLVGKTFRVGDATLVGIRLCEPCKHITKLVGEDFRKALVHRGGLRANILEGAVIRPGDPVAEVEEPPGSQDQLDDRGVA
jgi:MOSC domain-containing protein YiiM